jgi:shikimate kinase
VSRHQPPAPHRIVLVGFMAAGKTTVGRRLAELLGWEFLDFDEEIERRLELSVAEIFRVFGEPYFRQCEADLTREVAASTGMVLAPGGGWITQPELLERLRPGGVIIWLRVSPEEAVRRASGALSHRPLLAGEDPLERAQSLIARREPLYAQADLAIDVDGREGDDVAWEIIRSIEEWSGPGGSGGPWLGRTNEPN